jgi:hypothetical protein
MCFNLAGASEFFLPLANGSLRDNLIKVYVIILTMAWVFIVIAAVVILWFILRTTGFF